MSRQQELRTNLANLREEIEAACEAAHRDPATITLIAVTKNFPASDIRYLYEFGVSEFGESRVQELALKFDEIDDAAPTWHYLGRVQSNKIKDIARIADVVHSIDSLNQIEKFERSGQETGRTQNLLIQVNLDRDYPNQRGGVCPDDIEGLAGAIHARSNTNLGGLMFIASPKESPQVAFEKFQEVLEDFRLNHPQAFIASAGMSTDFREAIAIGATHLRIGSKLLGNRPV